MELPKKLNLTKNLSDLSLLSGVTWMSSSNNLQKGNIEKIWLILAGICSNWPLQSRSKCLHRMSMKSQVPTKLSTSSINRLIKQIRILKESPRSYRKSLHESIKTVVITSQSTRTQQCLWKRIKVTQGESRPIQIVDRPTTMVASGSTLIKTSLRLPNYLQTTWNSSKLTQFRSQKTIEDERWKLTGFRSSEMHRRTCNLCKMWITLHQCQSHLSLCPSWTSLTQTKHLSRTYQCQKESEKCNTAVLEWSMVVTQRELRCQSTAPSSALKSPLYEMHLTQQL